MLKWVARNKYKLMPAIAVLLYLAADLWLHKGEARVWWPDNFPVDKNYIIGPVNRNQLINSGRQWVQGVNTIEKLNGLPAETNGLECDVYFNLQKGIFEVHHDPDKSTGLGLDSLLTAYRRKKLAASVWLDFKNLVPANQQPALTELIRLRDKFGLQHKLLVESMQADPLAAFSDSGFFTSYYTPLFNPYLNSLQASGEWTDSLAAALHRSKADALSGYYFQYPMLKKYFPNYRILTWATRSRFSLVNGLFRRKLNNDRGLFIVLYP